jgi:hypothetical protein
MAFIELHCYCEQFSVCWDLINDYLCCFSGELQAHMVVIRDMRLIHQNDSQNQADYPVLVFQLQEIT